MNKLFGFAALALLAVAPSAGLAQSAMSTSATPLIMVGVGPHGYDWLIGTWSCTNSMPSPMGGPASQTLTVSRSTVGTSLYVRVSGTGLDASGFVAYVPKTKTWWNPNASSSGDSGSESSTQTGKKTVWTGSYFSAASGKTTSIRDTYTLLSTTKYTDLGQYQSGGAWKTSANTTCTKSM